MSAICEEWVPMQVLVRMMYELDDRVAENVIKNSKVPLPFRDKPGGKEIGKITRLFREGDFVMGEVEFYGGCWPS